MPVNPLELVNELIDDDDGGDDDDNADNKYDDNGGDDDDEVCLFLLLSEWLEGGDQSTTRDLPLPSSLTLVLSSSSS